jgi:hypothetical protein
MLAAKVVDTEEIIRMVAAEKAENRERIFFIWFLF